MRAVNRYSIRRLHPGHWLLTLCFASMGLLNPSPVYAQSCTVTSPTVNFGNSINMVSGTTYAPAGTQFTVSCSYPNVLVSTLAAFSVCLNLPGASSSTPRNMISGANNLGYNLYSDTPPSHLWGSTSAGNPSNVPVTVVTNTCGQLFGCGSVNGSTNVTIYGQLLSAGNTSAPAGSYIQVVNGTAPFNVAAGLLSGLLTSLNSCTNGTTNANSAGNFTVTSTATIANFCAATATTVNFGNSVGILNSTLTSTGTITNTCTNLDSYSITLSQGTTSGGTFGDRLMAGSGSAVVHYQLFTPTTITSSGGTGCNYSTVWGDATSGTSLVSDTGTGVAQNFTVCGRVQTQTTPAPGLYQDTILVTVTY